jgi:tetratricopeptide (TPR) repeat protein
VSSAWNLALAMPVVLAMSSPAPAAPATPPTGDQITRWVEQLGDNDFATRQKASQRLWEAGKPAEAALKAAARSDDLEVRRRASEILDKFRWGIYPDTPREVVTQIERYQSGTQQTKQEAVRKLFDLGGKGCAALVKVAAAEPDPEARQHLFQQIALDAGRAFASLMAEDDFTTLEQLLELGLAVEHGDPMYQNYAAYWMLRGKLDERIKEVRAKLGGEKDTTTWEVLTYLYRARGDLASAREAAEKTGRQELLEQVLADQGDWAALAKLADGRDSTGDFQALGFRVAYHRLAGDGPGLEKAVADLQKQVGDQTTDEVVWLCAKALFLNGRPREALALMEKRKSKAVLFEVLAAQLRFGEALALVEKSKPEDTPDLQALKVFQARTLYLLGDRDKAVKQFRSLGDAVQQGQNASWNDLLIKTEYRVGLKDLALEHCARILVTAQAENRQEQFLGLIFPKQGDRAAVWWRFLRDRPGPEDPVATLRRVRDLMEGRTSGKELEALAGEAEAAAQRLQPAEREPWLLAVAETCLAAGLDSVGRGYLEKAAAEGTTPAAPLRLGDYLAGKKQWEQAAARYGQAWEKDRKQPLALYLRGWALSQGGAAGEGAKLMDLAHWVPLGDEPARQQFAAELRKRGHDEAARRERAVLFAVGKPVSFYAGEALRETALDELARKEYLKAADDQDRALLRLLQPYTEFIEKAAYVGVPSYVHRLRALGLLAAGRADEARKEADVCLALLPGSVELPMQLVPELEKHGRKKDADDLFARTLATHEKLCADYPRGAWVHNNLAWLCAACRRNLDAGLEHARTAVELDPDNAGYLDTLAEVHFQRGDRDKAVELMKQCLAKDAKNVYFQKQLKRFEAGDRSAEIPSAAEN